MATSKALSNGGDFLKSIEEDVRRAEEFAKEARADDAKELHGSVMKSVFSLVLEMTKLRPDFLVTLRAIHALGTPSQISWLSKGRTDTLNAVQRYFSTPRTQRQREKFMYELYQRQMREICD